jgi:transposase-like protein
MKNKSHISDETVFTVMLRLQKGESVNKLAEEYGISNTTIKRWRKGKHRVSSDFNPKTTSVNQDRRIKELEQKVENLTLLLEDALTLLKKDENLS